METNGNKCEMQQNDNMIAAWNTKGYENVYSIPKAHKLVSFLARHCHTGEKACCWCHQNPPPSQGENN